MSTINLRAFAVLALAGALAAVLAFRVPAAERAQVHQAGRRLSRTADAVSARAQAAPSATSTSTAA